MEEAWAFYRRSTEKQELSIEDQKRDCHAFAKLHDYVITREFQPELGYGSGLTIDKDSSFLAMVRAAENEPHLAKYLLVYDVSRFGRLNPEEKIYWEQRFKRDGHLQLLYVKDEVKNDGSLTDTLTKVLKHSEAHEFSRKLSANTLRGCLSHARIGHSVGGRAPYGYDRALLDSYGSQVKILLDGEHKADKLQHVKWVPGEREKIEVLNKIFSSYDSGNGLNTIVSDLNENGIKSPKSRHWTKGIVHYILRNRAYIGERIYNKTSFKRYRRNERGFLRNPEDQWVVCENAHPAIINNELFERVQSKLKKRKFGTGRSYTFPHLLSGLIVCDNCGYRFNGMSKIGNGHKYRYYSCSGYQRIGKSICRSVSILADDLENMALDTIRERATSNSWRDRLKPTLKTLLKSQFDSEPKETHGDLQKEIDSVDRQIQNVLIAIKSGVTSSALMDELRVLETRKTLLNEKLGRLRDVPIATRDIDSTVEQVLNYADRFDELWNGVASIEEKKQFLKGFIYRTGITHSPESIAATFYLYKFPQMDKKMAGYAPIHVPDHLSLKSIAGVGFEPTTSRL